MEYARIDTARLKAAIDAIKDRKRPEIEQLRLAQRARLAKLRRNLGKEMRPLFSGARFDAAGIDKVLAQHRAEERDLLRKEKVEQAKQRAALAKARRAGIANTRQAVEQIKFKSYLTTSIPLETPFLIYATPVGMLHDTHVEPWNNWAKFTYTSGEDTAWSSVVVNFYFAWQNRSDFLAVLNCSADLMPTGIIEATAEAGWLFPGSAWVELIAGLTVFVGSTTINWQPYQNIQMGQVGAEGGWGLIGGSGDIGADTISGTYHLSASDIQVQPNEIVVFEVACTAGWWIDEGGSIVLDFDFDPGGYQVMCPALQIDLLTAPQSPIEN
ncbi:MAG TPA: hypothetical protein VHE77_20195 [Dongiaceae bacterium]|jgi:hypothetical protein|nr:hypothetical protein [Dongiaceae bacterium]